MKPPLEFPLTDEILTSFALAIGADLQGYRNHIYRVLNFHGALRGADGLSPDAVQIAAAFHDMGIDRKSTRLNSSHIQKSRMPSSA